MFVLLLVVRDATGTAAILESQDEKKGRPPVLPDSFHVLVVGK